MVARVIELRDLSFSYPGDESPTVLRANIKFEPGEFGLICGPTGSGKSTLLRLMNGLSPHFVSGRLSGELWINGVEQTGKLPHELAHLVGYVNQRPEDAFVADTVEDEIAYGLEQLGVERDEMAKRVADVAESFGLSGLLGEPLLNLSGGQQQRVAIASALAAGQRILLLDEPTSALDPSAASETLRLLHSLSRDEGLTVLIAEHRLERVLDSVDSVTVVNGDGSVSKAGVREQMRNHRTVPPVIELSQLLNWQPPAISTSEAASRWQDLAEAPTWSTREANGADASGGKSDWAIRVSALSVAYGTKVAVDNLSFELQSGAVVAVMGENGSGKTSLLWAMQGSGARSKGNVETVSGDPAKLPPDEQIRAVTMVPQQASDLLFMNSVAEEFAESDRFSRVAGGSTSAFFERLAGRVDPALHPRDLSSGQQLALVLAIQLVKDAGVVLLDEPTRGLDYEGKRALVRQLRQLRDEGKCVVVASHDIEFVAQVASRVLILEGGRLAFDGSAEAALASGQPLASQMSLIAEEPGLISVSQLAGAL